MIFDVFIPASEDAERILGILPGSAIVGSMGRPDPDMLQLDYEGNRYGAVNLHQFRERLRMAAYRHRERAPTVARQWAYPQLLQCVGLYDLDTDTLMCNRKREALDAWIERYGATHANA